MTLHIALWSGPGRGNTALLRSFASRADTHVSDQPLYGHFLARTGADHPRRDELLAVLPTDWRRVVGTLTGPAPDGSPVWVQKHMAHHVTLDVERGWLRGAKHVFVLEEPRRQVAWLAERLGQVRIEDTGLPHLLELFRWIRRTSGRTPLVVSSEQLFASPMATLASLCSALGLPFERGMLSWPTGVLPFDGPWAPEWYDGASGGYPSLSAADEESPLPPGYEALVRRLAPLHAELDADGLQLALS